MRALMLIALCVAPLCGCVNERLDEALMNVREQVVTNEALYSRATLKFSDAFQTLADQKHQFQRYLIEVEGDQWIDDHTKDGLVQATPEDFSSMLAKRDERLKTLESSEGSASQMLRDFRQMVNDKVALATAVYGKEVEAQKAKESLSASVDSIVKVLGGVAGAAAVAIPILAP